MARNHSSPSPATSPTKRASARWLHSHQNSGLNSASVMPTLICLYSGICWYLAKSACQSVSLSGGMTPISGFHSVMVRPECVSRVAPPTTTMHSTSAVSA